MTPFRRPGSPNLYVWPTVPLYGRVGPWSTGTKDKRQAEAMERMLRDLPLRGFGDILRMIPAEVSLPDVYVAHLEGRLEEIRAMKTDPKIADAIGAPDDEASFLNQLSDARVYAGMLDVLRLVPDGARLSYLRDPKHVENVLHAREREGAKRNTVRRSLYRAVSDLLDRELGSSAKTAIMAEVDFPQANDERKVTLRPDQLAKLLGAIGDPLFECFVGLAVTSGIDRGPLLRIQPQHFVEGQDGADDLLDVLDTKTAARPRTLALPFAASAYLRRAVQLRRAEPEDRVFPWTDSQVSKRWVAARDAAGLPWLRLKDLRSVFSEAFVEAGGTLKDLQGVLGHSSGKTSMRYTRAQPIRQRATMERAAELMLGSGRHLKLEGESA